MKRKSLKYILMSFVMFSCGNEVDKKFNTLLDDDTDSLVKGTQKVEFTGDLKDTIPKVKGVFIDFLQEASDSAMAFKYLDLRFNEKGSGLSFDDWDQVFVDGIYYSSEEITLKSVKKDSLKKYMDLRLKDTLYAYTSKNVLKETLKEPLGLRYNGMIEDWFIFKYDITISNDVRYVSSKRINSSKGSLFETRELYERISSYKEIQSLDTNEVLRSENKTVVFSVDNEDEFIVFQTWKDFYLFEINPDRLDLLYKNEGAIAGEVQLIPVEGSPYPLFLIGFYMPESCGKWTELLQFNGLEYLLCEGNVAKL